MSISELRMKAAAVQSQVRRNLIVAFVCGVLAVGFSVAVIVRIPSMTARAMVAAIIAWTFSITYRAWFRTWPAKALSPDAAWESGMEFYRNELKARHGAVALTWRFLVPLVVFFALTWQWLGMANNVNGHFVARVLLPSILAVILIARRWEVYKVQRELAALDTAMDTSPERDGYNERSTSLRPLILSAVVFAILFAVLLWLLPHMMNWILGTLRASHRTG